MVETWVIDVLVIPYVIHILIFHGMQSCCPLHFSQNVIPIYLGKIGFLILKYFFSVSLCFGMCDDTSLHLQLLIIERHGKMVTYVMCNYTTEIPIIEIHR